MKKKILAFTMACMMASLMAVSASAADTVEGAAYVKTTHDDTWCSDNSTYDAVVGQKVTWNCDCYDYSGETGMAWTYAPENVGATYAVNEDGSMTVVINPLEAGKAKIEVMGATWHALILNIRNADAQESDSAGSSPAETVSYVPNTDGSYVIPASRIGETLTAASFPQDGVSMRL